MPSKCFASWASPNWTRPPRRRDKNRSCSDQPQNPPPYLLGVTGHNVKHALENLTLRQQLAVLKRKHPRPRLPLDKLFWVLVRRLWSQWKEALFLVQPETVVRWHRAGFKLYWAMLCKVRKRVGGGRRISKPICDLIFQMVAENPSWGAASHPWRTSHARLRGIGNHHLTLDETGTQESSIHEALAGLSAQSPRGALISNDLEELQTVAERLTSTDSQSLRGIRE